MENIEFFSLYLVAEFQFFHFLALDRCPGMWWLTGIQPPALSKDAMAILSSERGNVDICG